MPVCNALTVDLEDWYHGYCALPSPSVDPCQKRVRRNTEAALALLSECGVRGTFFVLGSLAAEDPGLVPMIAAAGHEIASHGYSHTLVPQLGPEAFRDELRRTAEIIARQCGEPPAGFRAPQWSLGSGTPWAMEILQQEGYLYDSSWNPLPFVGDKKGPRSPFQIATDRGRLLEIPPMVTPSIIGNLPTGGGWGFRFWPRFLIRGTMEALNREGSPAVLYLHPRELDPFGPRLQLSRFQSFVSYGPRTDATVRLRELLNRFKFTTLKELAAAWQPA
ncbi:MAG TPA: polysaccharide deacetylase family protein [Geomonas sp.]|nr:polysaccharide deacetylase family protein [Geomonas sp.]